MSWTTHRHRGKVLRTVLETANRRCDGRLPLDLPGVAETFADDLDLLGALQLRWHARLSGRVERALMSEPMDLEGAVVAAWRAVAGEWPGVRAILDQYRDMPTSPAMAAAVRTATTKEHVLLAVMAGRANALQDDTATIAVGERIEAAARAGLESAQKTTAPAPGRRQGLIDRLRAALVA